MYWTTSPRGEVHWTPSQNGHSGHNTTLVYTTPSILRHIFARPNFLVQNPLSYTTTTLDNATFRISVLSFKEVVNARIPFIYVHLKYIRFHLGTTWELHLLLGTL